MANQGMLTIDEVLEQEKWITDPSGEIRRFYQDENVSIEENSPSFMEYSDLSDEQKASGRYQIPRRTT